MTEVRKIVHLSFPPDTSGKPVVCNIARHFDLCFNIVKAQISPREVGGMILEIYGQEESMQKGIAYLKEHGITITPVAQKVRRDEDTCVHCGVCTALCRPQALKIDSDTRKIRFDSEKCVACEMCVTVCPVHAMETLPDDGIL